MYNLFENSYIYNIDTNIVLGHIYNTNIILGFKKIAIHFYFFLKKLYLC